ncbi:hypothetical protein [Cupriavidus lacunae]|uniref:hypothetical protein n=1 Tax=Cupriavidus lacunae TaxID=2666307 RepID=UPI001374D6F9|nr:hypothetical protein [Cupriavidus lacunae]
MVALIAVVSTCVVVEKATVLPESDKQVLLSCDEATEDKKNIASTQQRSQIETNAD